MAYRLPLIPRFCTLLKPPPSTPVGLSRGSRALLLRQASTPNYSYRSSASCRSFCSGHLNLPHDSLGPATIDYRLLLQEDEFHRLSNSTIHDLQEKLEEYVDIVQIDGFDVDYGNEVLTQKLGALGTYVLNKQTTNLQIWLSSPVSGPSRFDWDHNAQAWVYRRTKANLGNLLKTKGDCLEVLQHIIFLDC